MEFNPESADCTYVVDVAVWKIIEDVRPGGKGLCVVIENNESTGHAPADPGSLLRSGFTVGGQLQSLHEQCM